MGDCKNCDLSSLGFLHKHAWEYFELHANQRISLFRFYILFLTLFLTGAGFMYVRYPSVRFMEEIAGMILSLAFAFITMMFHLLDRRNRQLIHYAEDALMVIENDAKFPNVALTKKDMHCKELKIEYLKIFEREGCDTCKGKYRIRHTTVYRAIFIAGYVIAAIFFFASFSSMFYYSGLAAFPGHPAFFSIYHY